MSLIRKIHLAAQAGALVEPFTTDDLKRWIERDGITKEDGKKYATSSINAILSNSDRVNRPTSNKNTKWMRSRIGALGRKEYWFE